MLRSVWGIFWSASKRTCNRKWEVRVGPETQGCPTCFWLSLQREREWLNVCQVWTEWETGSWSRGILPRQRSIITCSTNLHGDWNVFFNNMQSWMWSLSSHSRPYRYMYHKHIPAPFHILLRGDMWPSNTPPSRKKPLGYNTRASESTIHCLSDNIFHVLWVELTGRTNELHVWVEC